jgi:hypothetical protein
VKDLWNVNKFYSILFYDGNVMELKVAGEYLTLPDNFQHGTNEARQSVKSMFYVRVIHEKLTEYEKELFRYIILKQIKFL